MIELLTMGGALTPEYETPDYVSGSSMSAYIELYYPEWYNDSYVEDTKYNIEESEILDDSDITSVFNNIDE